MFKKVTLILLILTSFVFSSGGYDHGTSTGKGQLELDFTWNPFDLIEFGQSYVVLGYGITNSFDIHGYYSHQVDGEENYYYGIFYQIIDSKYIDLSSAIGLRNYNESNSQDLFFPQLLFTLKPSDRFFIGGAFVNVQRKIDDAYKSKGVAIDVSIYFPLSNVIQLPKFIDEMKLAFGIFKPGIIGSDDRELFPTYSIDFTFKKFGRKRK